MRREVDLGDECLDDIVLVGVEGGHGGDLRSLPEPARRSQLGRLAREVVDGLDGIFDGVAHDTLRDDGIEGVGAKGKREQPEDDRPKENIQSHGPSVML